MREKSQPNCKGLSDFKTFDVVDSNVLTLTLMVIIIFLMSALYFFSQSPFDVGR